MPRSHGSPHGSPKPCKKKECCTKKIEELEKQIEDLRKEMMEFKKIAEEEKKQCDKELQELKCKVDELEKNQCCCGFGGTEGPKGTWVPASQGEVPNGAIMSGPNPKYYVARAIMDSSLVPGKLAPNHKTCWVAWNNTEIKMDQYEVLVNTVCEWIAHKSSDPIPKNAIQGGYIQHESGKEILYIGRADLNNIIVPGYVFENSRELLHSSSYTNHRQDEYEILVQV